MPKSDRIHQGQKSAVVGLSNCSVCTYQATQPSLIFGYRHRHHRCRSGLFKARSTHSHTPTLAQKSARRGNYNPKTDVVVPVVRVVVVTIRRTAIPRIIVPGTTAQQPEVPTPSSPSCKYKRCEYLLT